MALIKFKDGKKKLVSEDVGVDIWRGLNGQIELTEKQAHYLETVDRIHIDYRHAPDDYISQYLDEILYMVTSGWQVNLAGRPTRPITRQDKEFAKRWGLYKRGRLGNIITKVQVELPI